jgi:hypothetical protein
MNKVINEFSDNLHRPGCNCCNNPLDQAPIEITRRQFVRVAGTGALATVALSGLSWTDIIEGQPFEGNSLKRQPLIVKPVLTYEIPERRNQTSWRAWGGIQTEKDAAEEIARINEELKVLKSGSDFPVEFLPVSGVTSTKEISTIGDTQSVDLFLIYAAGGGMDIFSDLNETGKNIIIFCRHKSGPVYLWYEIISPRFLRQHSDTLAVKGIDEDDVVIDSQDELQWRLRSLAGLMNTVGSRILAIGGPGAWAQPLDNAMKAVQDTYKLDILTISYDELSRLIIEARKNSHTIADARSSADEYLKTTGTKLETQRQFIENCFVLEDILKKLMNKYNCRAVTINNCMETIMPLAETTACLTLSLLNDGGYLAFCESDFIVVPSGILLANISGTPVFMNDPTYPHDKIITLAHCTAPRKMDGKKSEPARIMTHFESDYGAAPKVEMSVGQTVTNIMPDFAFKRNVGLLGKIIDNPIMDICRSQIDISYDCDSKKVAEQMPGFHWMTCYGDYIRETGYALKKIGIKFENLV